VRSDKAWDIISALAGVVAIILTVVLFYYGELRTTKQLEAVLISKTTLINPGIRSTREGLQLVYKGESIPDLHLFQLRFRNIGRQSIMKSDFEEPINIQISSIDRVIPPVTTLTAIPNDLSPRTAVTGTTTLIEGTLLNPDDEFTLEIAAIPIAGAEPFLHPPSARIAGIKKIVFRPTLEAPRSPIWSSIFISIIAALIGSALVIGILLRRRSMPLTVVTCNVPNGPPHLEIINRTLHCDAGHYFCLYHAGERCPICGGALHT
jgi:hypothetical protein